MKKKTGGRKRHGLMRLVFIWLLIFFVLPLVVFILWYSFARQSSNLDIYYNAEYQVFKNAVRNYDQRLEYLLLRTGELKNDPDLLLLSEPNDQIIFQEKIPYTVSLQDSMRTIERHFSDFASIRVALLNRDIMISTDEIFSLDYYSRTDPDVYVYLKSKKDISAKWIPQHLTGESEERKVFTWLVPFPMGKKKPDGVIIADILVPETGYPENNSFQGKYRSAVIQSDGTILFGNESNIDLQSYFSGLDLPEQGLTSFSDKGDRYTLMVDKSFFSDLSYVSVISERGYLKSLEGERREILFIFLPLLISVFLAGALLVSRKLTGPLERIVQAIESESLTPLEHLNLHTAEMKILSQLSEGFRTAELWSSHENAVRTSLIRGVLEGNGEMPAEDKELIGKENIFRIVYAYSPSLLRDFNHLHVFQDMLRDSSRGMMEISHLQFSDGYFVLLLKEGETALPREQLISIFSDAFRRLAPGERDYQAKFLFGNPVSSVADISLSFADCRALLDHIHCFGPEMCIFPVSDEPSFQDMDIEYPFAAAGKCLSHIKQSRRQKALDSYETLTADLEAQSSMVTWRAMYEAYRFWGNELMAFCSELPIDIKDELKEHFDDFFHWNRRFSGFSDLKLAGRKLLESVLDEEEKKHTRNDAIPAALDYISENFRQDLSLDFLSDFCGVTPQYFSTIFKRHTGLNFTSYLAVLRMKEAERYLKETDMQIQDIASAVGYSHSQYFIRVFKKHFGESPFNFRKKLRKEQLQEK
ncbi:MAG: AraC family transcriptional regulator [Spirochaetales bacterium]|nr:AraC family transcriptional regulator [Spirochaetales bacterium]